jgi:IS30 family transposase
MAKKKTKTRKQITHLSKKEIATVKTMTKKGATMRQIAKKIRRAPSTIWRWQQR